MDVESDVAVVVDSLREEHGLVVDVEERTISLREPTKGEPAFAVLRVLGLVEAASPVAVAAHGPKGVAAGLWRSPDLYLARWTRGKLWVVAYRLTAGSRPSDYVRIEGRIPTRFETDSWYDTAPEAVSEAFFEAGLLLDDPPFPVPKPAPVPPATPGPGRTRTAVPRKPRTAPAPRTKPATLRVCSTCGMQKALVQFAAGSDQCIDCR
ncbi:MAG: hypothetical protein JWP02_3575 [Acidimicrobiales bacterium]|nr:hypothetical protein [Acidimicrobiales bacterium]